MLIKTKKKTKTMKMIRKEAMEALNDCILMMDFSSLSDSVKLQIQKRIEKKKE